MQRQPPICASSTEPGVERDIPGLGLTMADGGEEMPEREEAQES